MLDPDQIITENHLRYRDSELLVHLINRLGLQYWQLVGTDSEALARDRGS